MSFMTQNQMGSSSGSSDFEETLRLIARLAPPEGLEERVRAGLRAAPARGSARILAWPVARPAEGYWLGSALARSAAAAAIVAVVIGGSWGVYSRVESIQPVRAITVPLNLTTQGGFSSAGAKRMPQTLNGPMVVPPPAVHEAAKPAVKPAGQLALRHGNSARKKAALQPAARPVQ